MNTPRPTQSPRYPLPTIQSPNESPTDLSPSSMSPSMTRLTPTGPRALSRSDIPTKKEYQSPVPDLDEKVQQHFTQTNCQLSKLKSEYKELDAKDAEVQKRKRAALAEWTYLDRESKREGAKVEMTEKLLEATVNGTLYVA